MKVSHNLSYLRDYCIVPLSDGRVAEWLFRTVINTLTFGHVLDKPVCYNNTAAFTETSGTAVSLEVASGLQLALTMKSIHLFGLSECLSLTLTCLDNSIRLYALTFSD